MMKLPFPLFLFVLPAIANPTAASHTTSASTPTPSALAARDASNANGEVLGASKAGAASSSGSGSDSGAGSKGTLAAPVDGKDGKPHEGPWIDDSGGIRQAEPKSESTISSVGGGDGVSSVPGEKKVEKVPEGPKEAKEVSAKGGAVGNNADLGTISKPSHLPEKPHDIPSAKYPSAKDDTLAYSGTKLASSSLSSDKLETGEVPASDPIHSLFFSFTMIVVSEIGDKTFLVAALMAMRHPRLLVFSAAFTALIGMTVLSAVLGHGIPTLIRKTFTKFLAAVLFFVFGLKMLKEGREMAPDEGVGEEMKEVEMELEEKEQEQLRLGHRRASATPHNLEAGRVGGRRQSRSSKNRMPSPPESLSSSSSRASSPASGRRWNDMLVGMSNLFSLLLSPAWVQTFAMTFLGEWGDRSQIATIAMAAGQDYWWVTVGAVTGHGICTAAAVIGGSAIAGRVSMRVVTLGGAAAFLVFGVIYLIEALYGA